MRNLSNFIPFFVLIFLISVIGFSTYKISKKQEIEQRDIQQSFDIRFVKEKIILPEFSLPNLFDEAENFSKKDLKGKYSLINLFASWCTTCIAEHEVLLRLRDEGIIDIYGVAWRDINENTKKYLATNDNPFKKVATDNQALFTKFIGIKAVPETLLINSEGDVVWRYAGNLEDHAVDEIRQFLSKNSRR
ncbi:MAG: hypothetical protein EBS06_03120 [Proteobacteria bacterium]|nr:hypothetical protein [Pseudomonadota bacterium]